MKLAKLAWSTMVAAALCAAPAAAAAETVVTSAVSRATFRLDTREGPFESTGTETISYSTRWHTNATVAIRANGTAVTNGLSGEGDYVWRATLNGTNVLTHVTDGSETETAIFVVRGLYPDPSATLKWKFAANANGWFCGQVALAWHPGYVDAISNMRLLFADRYDYADRLAAYLVDPATVAAPLGATEEFEGRVYRAAPIDLSGFANLATNVAIYGVSVATMESELDSVPKGERKICLRVANRDITSVAFINDKVAWLAWEEGSRTNFLPLVGSWATSETAQSSVQTAVAGNVQHSASAIRRSVLASPLSPGELSLSESFGLPPAAVAKAEVTCRISSTSIGADGSVEGTFEIAAEDAGRVVAESGELDAGVELMVLGATSLGGDFEPLGPDAGVELPSRKPPYAFRVKEPGDYRFFKVRLAAENKYE